MRNNLPTTLQNRQIGGLATSIGKPMTAGPILCVKHAKEIANVLSDVSTLAQYAEIAIEGRHHALPIYIKTESLLSNPQLFLGFNRKGFPLLLRANHHLEAHMIVIGQTRTAKLIV
jgi:hypothetical protein